MATPPGIYPSGPYPGGYQPQQSAGINKLFIILPVVIVVLLVIGGALFWFLPGEDASAIPTTTRTPATETSEIYASSEHARFGETYTWSDGVSFMVTVPESHSPGSSAADKIKYNPVKIRLTSINSSDKRVDDASVLCIMKSRDEHSPIIADPDNEIRTVPPQDSLEVGQEISWEHVFDVQDMSYLRLDCFRGDTSSTLPVYFTL